MSKRPEVEVVRFFFWKDLLCKFRLKKKKYSENKLEILRETKPYFDKVLIIFQRETDLFFFFRLRQPDFWKFQTTH